MIAGLEQAPVELESLCEEFSELKGKLPPEFTAGEEPLDPTDLTTLKSALPQVRELLLSRLLEEGDSR
ncbi:MAG: hypothetical protein JRG96_18710 [Deltaproteobacteria bacterium]|nr:hypothetical protein [Deltaproteobacteria bacterium]